MLGLIWAQARNRAIGRNGTMPWHVPEDLAFFRHVTNDHPVIMGRKTWEGLADKYRPLPNRTNIVVTRNQDFVADGGYVAHDLHHAERIANKYLGDDGIAWVMGGAQIYQEALHTASLLVITELDIDVPDADAFAPNINLDSNENWLAYEADPNEGWLESREGTRYRFRVFKKPELDVSFSLKSIFALS